MRKINKQTQPNSLTRWKKANPNTNYQDLGQAERQDIRTSCSNIFLCAYCCQFITGENDDCLNEHVQARRIAPNRSLDFTNIVASCTTEGQCDKAHGSQQLPLTPLMDECDTEQNNKALIEKRKQVAQALLWTNGIDPNDGLDDDELIKMLIEDIAQPKKGKFDGFASVVSNILRDWLACYP